MVERTPDWPTNPDGTPMRLGDMTTAQRATQMRAAGILYAEQHPLLLMQEKWLAICAGVRVNN